MASMTTELQSTLSSKKASQVMPRGMMLRTLVSTTALHSPWRLVTVTLVHQGIWHIALNMLALWALGRSLEPLLGRWRFLSLYLLSALGGSVLVYLLAPLNTATAGASGAPTATRSCWSTC